ncbi:hypothetical protein KVP10_08600 [Candidimonas humi]|uniref:Host specificity factor TipJ family phage tail protein n=1 Tax=Candidimonas humi TaxID=683355 RepID=A0ABV8NXA4_9BURK|nr:host specificity factor TipJ family phage tail protein [Candidimonas humi]MBV6304946.1 hypothetical protein [Candidimonas humi]
MEVIERPTVERPPLIVYPHAMVGAGRIIEVAAFRHNETLGDYIERTGIVVPSGRIRIWHNGARVPDALWMRLIPRTGDQIVIRQLPTGGDAGKIVRTVALVALALSAPWMAAQLGFAAGTLGGAIASGAIMIGGSLLITTLLPPLTASTAAAALSASTQTNPSYTLSGGQNQARLWQPMMLIFGRCKVVPDLGANYYTEYVGDTQYLNQVFHFGLQLNEVRDEGYYIGDTPIENYQGVQLQLPDPNTGALSMFPGNVDTIQGFALNSSVVNSRTTSLNTTHISIELAASLFYVNDQGGMDARSVDLRIQYRPVGGAWVDVGLLQDAVYASHYWALMRLDSSEYGTTETQVSYGSTNPSDHTDGDTVILREGSSSGGDSDLYTPPVYGVWRWKVHPYQLGQPWAGIAPDPLISYSVTPGVRLTGAKQEPTRQTIGIDLSAGQYDVQIWKTSADVSSSRESNQLAVNQILCYQPDTANYAGQRRLAVRIQATSQLNGALNELNSITQAWAWVWTGSAWQWAPTSNPAWWFLWYVRGQRDADGNRIYGACLPDSRIDIEGIKAWGTWCDAKRLTFNYVLKDAKSVHDVLVMIARAGRASYSWQSGKLGVIWDAANLPVVAVIGPYNIKAGTFKVSYNADQTADQVVVNFVNPAKGWIPDSVRANVPNVGVLNSVVTLDFDGCTDADMAGREANLIAADQEYHYRKVQWEMDLEGLIATRGDVVEMSHDLTVWSYAGRCLALTADTVKLDKPVPTGGTGWAMLRDPENNFALVAVTADTGGTGETDVLTIVGDLPAAFHIPTDDGYGTLPIFDWAWQFDPLATPGRRIKIIDVQGGEDMGLKFTGQDDNPDYYACETNLYAYTPPKDGALLSGIVFDIDFVEGFYNSLSQRATMVVSWTVSVFAPVDVIVVVNGAQRSSTRLSTRSMTLSDLRRGDVVTVTVKPATLPNQGTPRTETYTIVGAAVAPADVTGLAIVPDGARLGLSWSSSPTPDVVGYEVRDTDAGWGTSGYLFRGDARQCLVMPGDVGVEKVWYVRAFTAAGLYSENSASISHTAATIPNVTGITFSFFDTSQTSATITMDWNGVTPEFGLNTYRVSYGSVTKDTKSTTITLPADWIGSRTFKICTVDALDRVSDGANIAIEKLAPNAPTGVRAQVIDNNVLLFWTLPEPTTLPVSHMRLKKGDAWASASDVGSKKGSFTTLQELQAGTYTYWLATVDTDGNESVPVSIVTNVAQPPDFIFHGELHSDFSSTKTNALVAGGSLLLPVDTASTWQDHFSTRSWGSPSDQATAGFPIYAQPTPTPGTYTEVFDFGTVVPSSQVTVIMDALVVAGAPILAPTIETSTDNATWSSPTNGLETFAVDFRYVRIKFIVSQSGTETALYQIKALSVRLSTKLKNDAGSVSALASDTQGTIANFNVDFIDVSSITLTPAGTVSRTAVYDFKDAPLSGTYAIDSGTVTVNVADHGLLAGQDVMLNYADIAPERVTVLLADTDSFTASVSHPDQSGSLQIYAQSMRIYLFDKDGARQDGVVSWAIRGN